MEIGIRTILVVAFLCTLRLWFSLLSRNDQPDNRQGFMITRAISAMMLAISLAVWFFWPGLAEVSVPLTVRCVGIALCTLGAALRVWAQNSLGQSWSVGIVPRQGCVVERGPYAWIRHPIYTSYLIMTPGLFLMTMNWQVGAAACVFTAVSLIRIPAEEHQLVNYLGQQYLDYCQRVRGRVWPRLQ